MPEWLTKPEMLVTFILFVLSVVVSLYSSELKRLLKIPFQRAGMSFTRWQLDQCEYQLALLNRLNNNAYRLLLWVLWNVLLVVYWAAWAGGVMFAVGLISRYVQPQPGPTLSAGFGSVLVGGIIGRGIKMREVVRALYEYEASCEELRNTIADCRAKLGLGSVSAAAKV